MKQFFLFFISCSLLHGSSEPSAPICEIAHSTLVADCVDVISGGFCITITGFVVPGETPLPIQYYYNSAAYDFFQSHPSCCSNGLKCTLSSKGEVSMDGTQFSISLPDGETLYFHRGRASCYRGHNVLGAQPTPHKNMALSRLFAGREQKEIIVQEPNGSAARLKQFLGYGFVLGAIRNPNGTFTMLGKEGVKCLGTMVHRDMKALGSRAPWFYSQQYTDHGHRVEVTQSNKFPFEVTIKRSHLPDLTCTHTRFASERKERMDSVQRPDGRYVKIQYYDKGRNVVGDRVVEQPGNTTKAFYHWRTRRVAALIAPVGREGSARITHRFFYHTPELTEVLDAAGHRTFYHYQEKTGRLNEIGFYSGNGIEKNDYLYHHGVCFFWGEKDPLRSSLMGRIYKGLEGRPLAGQHYEYDPESGDLLRETLYGNLTGALSAPFKHLGEGVLEEAESFSTEYRYTEDGFHLVTWQKDSLGHVTRYSYRPLTNLVEKELFGTEEQILSRRFCDYSEDAFQVFEIVDDGSGEELEDLTDVTSRLITRYTATDSFPYNLPKRIECYALDLRSGEEVLLAAEERVYDHCGNITQKTLFGSDNLPASTYQFAYDENNNCILEIDPLGREIVRRFDANCNKVYERGPDQRFFTTYTYDLADRLLEERQIHDDGVELATQHVYNVLGQCVKTISPHGHETRFTYNEFGLPLSTTTPKVEGVSPTTRLKYDVACCPVAKTDTAGHITRMRYNCRRQPTYRKHPDGAVEEWSYTLDGKVETHTKTGLTTCYTYDALGLVTKEELFDEKQQSLTTICYRYAGARLVEKTLPDGEREHYSYDLAGRLIERKDSCGCMRLIYDALGRESQVTTCSPEGTPLQIERISYDAVGRMTCKELLDAEGKTLFATQYTYDVLDHVVVLSESTHAGEVITITHHNSRGQIEQKIDALGNTTQFYYKHLKGDPDHSYVQIEVDPTGLTKRIAFDAYGRPRIEKTIAPTGHLLTRTVHTYDLLGREVHRIDGVQKLRKSHMSYTSTGLLRSLTQGVGSPEETTTSYRYNERGLRVATHLPDGNVLRTFYDSKNRTQQEYDDKGTLSYSYTYDVCDRITVVKDTLTHASTTRSYDARGKVVEETLANGLILSYKHDALGRTTLIRLPDESEVRYTYSPLGLEKITRIDSLGQESYEQLYHDRDAGGSPLSITLAANAGTLHFTYDKLSRVTSLTHPRLEERVLEGGFDAAGNLLRYSRKDPVGIVDHNYHYNPLHQLTEENSHTSHSWKLDDLQNPLERDEESCETNVLNQLLRIGEKTYSYDALGNLSQDGNARYTYDALGRLISAKLQDREICYTYDAFHRRMSREVEGDSTLYLWAGQNEIGSYRNGALQELRVLGNGYGREVGAAATIEIAGTLYIPLHDLRGNVSVLLNDEGEVVQTYRYTAYGRAEVHGTLELYNPWRFSSKRVDPDTHLLHFGRRDYHPQLERFISPDPLRFEAGANFYVYAGANPLVLIDPTGLAGQGLWDRTRKWIPAPVRSVGRGMQCFTHHLLGKPRIVLHFISSVIAGDPHPVHNVLGPSSPYELHRIVNKGNVVNTNANICVQLGVLSTEGKEMDLARSLSSGSGQEVHVVLNPSYGLFEDCCGAEHLVLGSKRDICVKAVVLKWKELIDLAGGPKSDVVNLHICHSKAAAIALRALEQLEPEYRPHIHVLAIAGPIAIPDDLAGRVNNVWRAGDPVAGLRDWLKYREVKNDRDVPGYTISLLGDNGCPVTRNSENKGSSFSCRLEKHYWKGNNVYEYSVDQFLSKYFPN